MTRDDLLGYLSHDNVGAFLHVLREGESSNDDSAYTILNGGEHFEAPPWEHPNRVGKSGKSTAAGAYQQIFKTWTNLSAQYGLPDFSPINQDCAAVALIMQHGAMDLVLAGSIREAIRRINQRWVEWECFENPIFLSKVKAIFEAYGGKSGEASLPSPSPSPSQSPKEVKPMAPLVIPILSALSSIIPALGQLFGSGSEVANRNIAAGTILAQKITEVTQSVNLQEAAEKIQNNPAALQAARDAVRDTLPQITEMGGGGIDGARKVSFAPEQIPYWRNPAFMLSVILVPLIYMVAIEILFNPSKQTWSDDIKMMFVTAIVSGLLGSITGFFLGSSLKDNGGQRRGDVVQK